MNKEESNRMLTRLRQELNDLRELTDRLSELEDLDREIGGFDTAILLGYELIDADDFDDHCIDLAVEKGLIKRDSVLFEFVNWEDFAESCKDDYTELTVGNRTLYFMKE